MKQKNGQKNALIFLFVLFFGASMTAQNTPIFKWTEKLGGGGKDLAHRIIQNKQGQFVVVGEAAGWFKDTDMAFTIVDSTGTAGQTFMFGGGGSESANSVVQTRDGGYVIVGFTDSKGFAKYGKQDAWLVKVDETGLLLWSFPFGTTGNDEFKDVVEAENGDLWLTGQSDNKLWVVRVDKNGKNEKATILSSDAKTTCGNALVWSKDKRVLYVVGQKVVKHPDGESQLLLVPFDTEGSMNFGGEKMLPKAEGKGIVRDRKGNLGIVGTSYELRAFNTKTQYTKIHTKILFCYYDVNSGNFSEPSLFSTGLKDDAKGLGIGEDLDGQFIIVGTSLKNPQDNDQKRQAWMQKVGSDGKKLWNEPIWYGGTYENGFTSVVVSERGFPIVVSNTGLKKDAMMVVIHRQTTVVNPKKPVLDIVAGRFHDEEDSSYLRRQHRGFYSFWLENNDTADVFGILATVRPQVDKHKPLLGEFCRIHIGTLRKGERRLITVPLEGDVNLQRDMCEFDIDFSTEKAPLSVNHSFSLRTMDVMKHNLEMVNSSFPDSIRPGKTYKFSFSLKNTGELAATNVQIVLIPESGTRINILDKKERFRTEDIEVGETRLFEASFEVQKEFYSDVVLLNIFAQVNDDKLGKRFRLQNNMPPPPPSDTIRSTWIKPTPEDIRKGNIVNAFQDAEMGLPNYPIEAIVESNEPIPIENIRLFIDKKPYKSDAKFGNIRVSELKSVGGYRFKMYGNISLYKEVTRLQIKVENIVNSKESVELKLTNKRIPNLYVLAVGVSYKTNGNVYNKLEFTKADADSMCAVLKRQKGLFFKNVVAKSLTTPVETEGQTIKNQIAIMGKEMTENDVLVLLLSGHGYIHGRSGNNIVFQANDYDDLKPETYLDYKTEIEAPLRSVRGQKLVFIDACQKYDGVEIPVKSGGESDPRLASAWASIVSAGPSYRVMLSCSKGQRSYEDAKLKHGVFTYALLEAFKNDNSNNELQANVGEADENPDQFLTFKELANFVKKRVPILCEIKTKEKELEYNKEDRIFEFKQTPLVFDDGTQDIPIFMYPKE